jgi:hypothetical protein
VGLPQYAFMMMCLVKNHGDNFTFTIGGMIILKWILEKQMVRCGLDSCGSGQGLMLGFCEHGIEPSDSIKGTVFLN